MKKLFLLLSLFILLVSYKRESHITPERIQRIKLSKTIYLGNYNIIYVNNICKMDGTYISNHN
jgi:hypothetical protein